MNVLFGSMEGSPRIQSGHDKVLLFIVNSYWFILKQLSNPPSSILATA